MNAYSALRWSILQMSSSWLIVLFRFSIKSILIFLPTCSLKYWQGILKSLTLIVNFVCFSLQSYRLLHHVFWSYVIKTFRIVVSSRWTDPFIIIKWPSLSLAEFLALKSTLSDINVATLDFFWLVLSQYILFHPFKQKLLLRRESIFHAE